MSKTHCLLSLLSSCLEPWQWLSRSTIRSALKYSVSRSSYGPVRAVKVVFQVVPSEREHAWRALFSQRSALNALPSKVWGLRCAPPRRLEKTFRFTFAPFWKRISHLKPLSHKNGGIQRNDETSSSTNIHFSWNALGGEKWCVCTSEKRVRRSTDINTFMEQCKERKKLYYRCVYLCLIPGFTVYLN